MWPLRLPLIVLAYILKNLVLMYPVLLFMLLSWEHCYKVCVTILGSYNVADSALSYSVYVGSQLLWPCGGYRLAAALLFTYSSQA